jgi:hypothetical protein
VKVSSHHSLAEKQSFLDLREHFYLSLDYQTSLGVTLYSLERMKQSKRASRGSISVAMASSPLTSRQLVSVSKNFEELRRNFEGTSKELRRNFEGTSKELRRNFEGTSKELRGNFGETF